MAALVVDSHYSLSPFNESIMCLSQTFLFLELTWVFYDFIQYRLVPDILLRFLRHCFLLDECFNCFSFVFKILLFVFLLWHYVFDLIVKLPDIILLSTQKLGHITFQLSNFKL